METDRRFLGLRDYEPLVLTGEAALAQQLPRLRGLLGSSLLRSFSVWDADDDTWFTDAPVVLDFGELRMELAAFKLDLCLSWNSIDVADGIVWYGASNLSLEWREDALVPLVSLVGRAIDGIELVYYDGVLNGLALTSDDVSAELFNALDELGISSAIEYGAETTRVPVERPI